MELKTTTVDTLAGSDVTLPCPGLGHTPFVVSLSWLCELCGGAGGAGGGGGVPPRTLLKYRDGRVLPRDGEADERLRLDDMTYALLISRARAADTGMYFCLVNSRQQPKGAIRLQVKGEALSKQVEDESRGGELAS